MTSSSPAQALRAAKPITVRGNQDGRTYGAIQTMPSAHEVQARQAKAIAIVTVLRQHGIGSEFAALIDTDGRLAAASLASPEKLPKKPPSQETWDLVVRLLQVAETEATSHPDPFEGLPQ